MGKGTIAVSKQNDYTRVEILRRDGGKTVYRYKTQDEYIAPFLSVENLRYYVSLNDTDEEDDYLLYHALQEEKKVAASFWTRNEKLIRDVFSDHHLYDVVSKNTWKEDFKTVFVARKGCLEDYFDIDSIIEWYDKHIAFYNEGVFELMCGEEIINVLTGGFCHPLKSTMYSPFIRFEGDEVLRDFGAAGLMVSGLLFGYPLESTADLINHLIIY